MSGTKGLVQQCPFLKIPGSYLGLLWASTLVFYADAGIWKTISFGLKRSRYGAHVAWYLQFSPIFKQIDVQNILASFTCTVVRSAFFLKSTRPADDTPEHDSQARWRLYDVFKSCGPVFFLFA